MQQSKRIAVAFSALLISAGLGYGAGFWLVPMAKSQAARWSVINRSSPDRSKDGPNKSYDAGSALRLKAMETARQGGNDHYQYSSQLAPAPIAGH